jgi:ABC-type phosphate/phosphonate transport system substrate-binding protein
MVTWLAPGLPLAFFERIRGALADHLNVRVTLESRAKRSGPVVGSADPFGEGGADVGFMCAPACVPTHLRKEAGFDLLGLAPVFEDPRYHGKPCCYCDLVTRQGADFSILEDLRGSRFGFNDQASLSGWLGLSTRLESLNTHPNEFFGSVIHTGGHLHSLKALKEGTIDVASIDSNVLCSHGDSLQGLRVLDSVGPWPSQPVVVRLTMSEIERKSIKDALLTCGPWPEFGFTGFGHQKSEDLEQVPTAAKDKRKGC